MILNDEAHEEFVLAGIFKEGITTTISDHYLVWMILSLREVKN
jgi:hypothetical protein